MDVDFSSSRIRSAKHLSLSEVACLNSADTNLYDPEGEVITGALFPCPFCYLDIEVHMLCSHFQEEHFFDLRKEVCPVCAGSPGKDVTGHFILHHSSSLKLRRKYQNSSLPGGSATIIGKELISFLGFSLSITDGSAPIPVSPPHDNSCFRDQSTDSTVLSQKSLLRDEVLERDEERRQRAKFAQQLIVSTIF